MHEKMLDMAVGIKEIIGMDSNILKEPKRLLGYLADWYPGYEDQLLYLKDAILSEASIILNDQVEKDCINVQHIFDSLKVNNYEMQEKLNEYLEVLFKACDISHSYHRSEIYSNTEGYTGKYAIHIEKEQTKRSAEEYYQLACLQKTERGIQDINKYIEFLEIAAENGHWKAKHTIALFYLKGKYVGTDLQKGFKLLEECASNGDVVSMYELYMYSQRFPQGNFAKDKAFYYLKQAAQSGYSNAEYDLAMQYYENGVEADYVKAFELLRKLADKNDGSAMYQLALCYRYGHGTERNMTLAMEILHKAAELGHRRAIEIIGG